MRIVIITLPRTGGTNFGKWLAKELDYQFITEPINYKRQNINDYKDEDLEKDNIVVKYTYDELRYKLNNFEELIKKFDFSILHFRKNLYEQVRSFLYFQEYLEIDNNILWHKPYFIYNDWEIKNKNFIEQTIKNFEKFTNEILELNTDLVTTYEEIFYENGYEKITKLLDFEPKYLDIINSSNRYCQGTKTFKNKENKTLL